MQKLQKFMQTYDYTKNSYFPRILMQKDQKLTQIKAICW